MKLSTTITTRILTGKLHHRLLRHISTASATTDTAAKPATIRKESLFQKLYEVGLSGGKVSDVLHRTMRAGKQISKPTLIHCIKDLRKLGRHHHCLEILDWLEKGRYDYSSMDYALRIDILYKLKGLDEAEKYFDNIPSDMQNHSTYGALLHCYCTELATDKALATFRKMEEMGFDSHVLAFNSLLNLFVKVGQPEKVSELIADMKHRNLPLNGHTYSFWIQSYRLLGDVEGAERVFHEAQEQTVVMDDWVIYSNIASVFIEYGQSEKAIAHLEKLENVMDNSDKPNRASYHHLISLYANAGKLESVLRTWSKLKSKFKVINTQSYLSLLQALSKLDDIERLEQYFREWESNCKQSKHYDDRLPAILIGAYLRHDMLQKAEVFLEDCTKKAEKILRMPHVTFMNYYFEKGKTDFVLKHMEVAINSKWKPTAQKLDPCFQHFKDQKDVDGIEKFCRLLKKVQPLDARAYSWLLQTYVEAEERAPDMRERIEEDGVNISPELEELLERVCPN
ncbi:hypothetical protein RND81_02G002900 [Saponaria officinalis]|uniref:Pentatricopeptide repeat-containing protein n=1 Tax=Saponaria officinalis TaxID=3572 RepID=A0AAW1MU16_SAPOF